MAFDAPVNSSARNRRCTSAGGGVRTELRTWSLRSSVRTPPPAEVHLRFRAEEFTGASKAIDPVPLAAHTENQQIRDNLPSNAGFKIRLPRLSLRKELV